MKNFYFPRFFLFALLLACNNDAPAPEPCTTDAYCEQNTRYFCEQGKLLSEQCESPLVCSHGLCTTGNDACDVSTFQQSCKDNVHTYCDKGLVVTLPCDEGSACFEGTCQALAQCQDNYQARCEDGASVRCEGGKIIRELCSKPELCISGHCTTAPESCGNGIVEPDSENCDDGAQNGDYGKCRMDCQSTALCGDMILDAPHEQCDDGSRNGEYNHCQNDCQGVARCGDKILEKEHEECDPPSQDWLITCEADCKTANSLFPDWPQNVDFTNPDNQVCSNSNLLSKYMAYRQRFIGDVAKNIPGFVSWGESAGESLPASSRQPDANCKTMWDFNYGNSRCAFNDLADAQGAYKWGDTTMWLGIMAHWLATEYRMFELLGIDTTQTEHLIALTLKALNRLDTTAETLFGLEGRLDGFFLRDDIPRGFYKSGTNYRFARHDAPNLGYECAASGTTCQLYNHISAPELLNSGSFISQDQVTGLFEGYGMLAKFLQPNAQSGGFSLRQETLLTIDRILKLFKANNWSLGMQTSQAWLQIPDAWGGYVQMFSGLFAEAANKIVGDQLGTADYHDSVSSASLGAMKALLHRLWPLWETNNNYNRNLVLRVIAYTEIWDEATYTKFALDSGREVFALARALIWDTPINDNFPLWRIHHILSSAPCSGPCNGPTCITPTPGWMGESYFVSPVERFGAKHYTGEYNGLDYLLAHNLYFLAYAQKTGFAYSQRIPVSLTPVAGALETMLQSGTTPSSYDAKAGSNISDLALRFCGRNFADWLRDNALGLVDIYTKDTRWLCKLDGKCQLSSDSAPYTHKNALILGTQGNDTLNIPQGFHHCIATLGGNDSITTASGHHVIEAGDGDDLIHTSTGNVIIYAGSGNDEIHAGSSFNQILGEDGNDVIYGAAGTDLIDGGAGNDVIDGAGGNNQLLGGDGNDLIIAGNGDNSIWGGQGDDKIRVGDGNNRIQGSDGRNFILMGNGNNNVAAHEPQDEDLFICFGSGTNTIWAGWTPYSHCSPAQNSQLNDSCKQDLDASFCSLDNFNAWH